MKINNDEVALEGDLVAELQAAGLRKTSSRLALLRAIHTALPHHFTVADLCEAVHRKRLKVSQATVYNCLNDFTRVGLLMQVNVPSAELYYELRCDSHHHIFVEEREELIDVPDCDVEIHDDGTIRLPSRYMRNAPGRIELFVTIKKG